MSVRRNLVFASLIAASFSTALTVASAAQEDHHRGRKYKAPPDTSHIEIEVLRSSNGKPIANAAIVFNPEKDGKDLGSLEVKSGPDGKASIDVIPTGSNVRVQIIADGYATFAEDFVITEASKEISVKMLRPRAQVSAYQDNSGKPSDRKVGVQEPIRPKPGDAARPSSSAPPADAPAAAPDTTTPAPTPATKPNN